MQLPTILYKQVSLFYRYTSQWTLYLSMYFMTNLAFDGFMQVLGKSFYTGVNSTQAMRAGQIYLFATLLLLLTEYAASKMDRPKKVFTNIEVGLKLVWLLFTFTFNYYILGFIDAYKMGECGGNSPIACEGPSIYTGFIFLSLVVFSSIILKGWNKQHRLFTFN